jgi:hypothetical protein
MGQISGHVLDLKAREVLTRILSGGWQRAVRKSEQALAGDLTKNHYSTLSVDYTDVHRKRGLLQSLPREGVCTAGKVSAHPLIVFDWDDTLVCSTYLQYNYPKGAIQDLPEPDRQIVQALQKACMNLLSTALSLGQTYIITNASDGWVETCARTWLPSVVPLLEKVQVVSARSRFEAQFPNAAKRWKEEMFLEIKRQLNSKTINLVCMGDSECEMEAAQVMGRQYPQSAIKLIKFAEFPSPLQLLKQQELVIEEFQHIVSHTHNLRVELTWPLKDGAPTYTGMGKSNGA